MWAEGIRRRAFQVERIAVDTTTGGEKARAQGTRGGWCGPSDGEGRSER